MGRVIYGSRRTGNIVVEVKEEACAKVAGNKDHLQAWVFTCLG
jgi:hypothetical protein